MSLACNTLLRLLYKIKIDKNIFTFKLTYTIFNSFFAISTHQSQGALGMLFH